MPQLDQFSSMGDLETPQRQCFQQCYPECILGADNKRGSSMVHSWGSGPPEPFLGPVSLPFWSFPWFKSGMYTVSATGCEWVFGCVVCIIVLLVLLLNEMMHSSPALFEEKNTSDFHLSQEKKSVTRQTNKY